LKRFLYITNVQYVLNTLILRCKRPGTYELYTTIIEHMNMHAFDNLNNLTINIYVRLTKIVKHGTKLLTQTKPPFFVLVLIIIVIIRVMPFEKKTCLF